MSYGRRVGGVGGRWWWWLWAGCVGGRKGEGGGGEPRIHDELLCALLQYGLGAWHEDRTVGDRRVHAGLQCGHLGGTLLLQLLLRREPFSGNLGS